MKKTHLGILLLILGFSFTASGAKALNLSELNCTAAADSKKLNITQLKTTLTLSGIPTQSKASCQLIEFKGTKFIQVQYQTKEHVSYSGRQRIVRDLEIFKLGSNELLLTQNLDNVSFVWSIENAHLLLRLKAVDDSGKPINLNGHIFDAKKNRFVDYQVFASRNGWDYKE